MKKALKRLTSTVAVVLACSIFAGCSGNSTTATDPKKDPQATEAGSNKTGLDISKKVELQFYMLGDAPKDLSLIQDEINKMALEDLNATVKFNFTTWTDWEQKYKLLLSSGQPIDLIFTADWTKYQSYAKKNAFLPLEDLLPKAAPKLQAFITEDYWNGVKVEGKIYTVPATWKEYVTEGIAYREDLRKKYNLPKPDSISNLESYLDGIKKNEPNLLPIADTEVGAAGAIRQLTTKPVQSNWMVPYGLDIQYETATTVTPYWGSDQHLEDLKTLKRFADKGFWPKNVLNIKDSAHDIFASGKAAAILGGENPNRFGASLAKIKSTHPEWELGYVAYPSLHGFAQAVHPVHNGFAIPRSSNNPERALAFYEKLVMDKRYNWLTQYGMEGKHFEVAEGKYYTTIGDASTSGFPREGMNGWAWRNPEFNLFDKDFDVVLNMFAEFDKIAKPDLFQGFPEDWTPYQTEKAAVEQVEKQYLYPLNVGLVDDVEGGLKTFMEKAKAAGLDKIQAEFQKQWLQYLNDQGVK